MSSSPFLTNNRMLYEALELTFTYKTAKKIFRHKWLLPLKSVFTYLDTKWRVNQRKMYTGLQKHKHFSTNTYRRHTLRNLRRFNRRRLGGWAASGMLFVSGNKGKDWKVTEVTCLDKMVKSILCAVFPTPRQGPDRCHFRLCFGSTCLQILVWQVNHPETPEFPSKDGRGREGAARP